MKRLEFGDMVFYAAAGLILILLLWLRFLEARAGLWGAWVVWIAWVAFLVGRYLHGRMIDNNRERPEARGAAKEQSTARGGNS
jgi:uncharacterized membrane protein YecN with MAPEG domain